MNHRSAVLLLICWMTLSVSHVYAHEGHNEAFSGGETAASVPTQKISVAPEGQRAIGIKVQAVGSGTLDQTLSTTGQVQAAENRANDINPPVSGVVRQVSFKQGDWVRTGQVLATIHSPEIAQTLSELLQERARLQAEIATTRAQTQRDIAVQSSRLELNRANFHREQTLLNEGITARRDYQQARTDYQTAQAELTATRRQSSQQIALLDRQIQVTTSAVQSQLRAMGLPASSVNRSLSNWRVTSQIPIVSPVSGYITFRDITAGETVAPDKRIFSITSLSPIWVILNVFQEQIPQVRTGQDVRITTPAGQTVNGDISTIGTVVDPNQRTLPVRVVSSNPGNLLKPGMSVRAGIVTGQTGGSRIVIPESAVVEQAGEFLTYVKQGNAFLPTPVRIGQRTATEVEILDGLYPGDHVVIQGANQLQAQARLAQNIGKTEESVQTKTQEQDNNWLTLLLGVAIGLGLALLGLTGWFLARRRTRQPRIR